MKISELLDDIRKYDLAELEFYREFLWTKGQVKTPLSFLG
jgi:hypothetical protein